MPHLAAAEPSSIRRLLAPNVSEGISANPLTSRSGLDDLRRLGTSANAELVLNATLSLGCLERLQLLPNVVFVGRPISGRTGDEDFGYFQGPVAIDANVFSPWLPNQQHIGPRSGVYGHSQTPEARAAAVTLIPDHKIGQPRTKEEKHHHDEGIAQVVSERGHNQRLGMPAEKGGCGRQEKIQTAPDGAHQSAGCQHFRQEIGPVPHMTLTPFLPF